MKRTLLSHLRDKNTSQKDFRFYSERLAEELAYDLFKRLPTREIPISTMITDTVGSELKGEHLIVPILRSGLAMLFPFLRLFHDAKVGFLGMKRNEKSFLPEVYYEKLTSIEKDWQVIILDPMIATGGSSKKAIETLIRRGAVESNIWLVSYIGSKEGVDFLNKTHPKIEIIVGEVDPFLNDAKFISPGLGDFGDRYFME